MTGLVTASYRNRRVSKGPLLPQLHWVLFLSLAHLRLQNSLGLSICNFKGLCCPTAAQNPTLQTLLCPLLLSNSSPSETMHPSRGRQPQGLSSVQVIGLHFRGEILFLAPPLEICGILTAVSKTRLAWWVKAEFGPKAVRSQLPEAPVWLWAPVNAQTLMAPCRMCSHASAAMQGSSADLTPASLFLRLAVCLREGEERLRKEDRKGSVCWNAQNGTTTACFSELYLQMASAVLPIQSHVLKHSHHSSGCRNDHFRRRKEKGEKDMDTSRFSTLTQPWCCKKFSVEENKRWEPRSDWEIVRVKEI